MCVEYRGAHLQLLNDVLVVGAAQGLFARPCAGRGPPVFGCPLHHGAVDFERQGVDLTVQVHGDGDGSRLGCGESPLKIRRGFAEAIHALRLVLTLI